MLGLLLLLAAASAPEAADKPLTESRAHAAFAAARVAIGGGSATVTCFPNPHSSDAPSCEDMRAEVLQTDVTKLVHFMRSGCVIENRPSRCIMLTFDRGRPDRSQTTLILVARREPVWKSVDIASILITQAPPSSD